MQKKSGKNLAGWKKSSNFAPAFEKEARATAVAPVLKSWKPHGLRRKVNRENSRLPNY